MAAFCENCNENLCSTEDGKSNDPLSNSWHLKKHFSPWISFNSHEQSVKKNVCAERTESNNKQLDKNEDMKK
jgi:hypothetical protein